MKTLQIEFAPKSLARRFNALSVSTLLLILVALVLTVGFIVRYGQLWKKQQQLEVSVQVVQTAILAVDAQQPKTPQVKLTQDKVTAINQAIAQLNVPWSDVLDALEHATNDKVALLQVTPDTRKAGLKLTAETKASADMVAYIEMLKQQDLFTSIVLEKHEINEQDPNKPLRFQLQVQWQWRSQARGENE